MSRKITFVLLSHTLNTPFSIEELKNFVAGFKTFKTEGVYFFEDEKEKIEKNSIIVVRFDSGLSVEKYKKLLDFAEKNKNFVLFLIKHGEANGEYFKLFDKYNIVDIVNTPLRAVSILHSLKDIS